MIEAAIVDASVVVKWVVAEAASERAVALQSSILSAPESLLAECGNALWAKARRNEILEAEAVAALEALEHAPVALVSLVDLTRPALRLGFLLGHPIHDCLYLALAIGTGVPLVTSDRGLIRSIRESEDLARLVLPLDELEP